MVSTSKTGIMYKKELIVGEALKLVFTGTSGSPGWILDISNLPSFSKI